MIILTAIVPVVLLLLALRITVRSFDEGLPLLVLCIGLTVNQLADTFPQLAYKSAVKFVALLIQGVGILLIGRNVFKEFPPKSTGKKQEEIQVQRPVVPVDSWPPPPS